MAAPSSKATMPDSFNAINHLKLPCFSIQRTHEFYTKIFPFIPIPQYNHLTPQHELFAKMIQHEPSQLIIEVRYVPAQAKAQKGWDPITFGVGTKKDLEQWGKWFNANGVKHSRIFASIKG
jgi:hypothetical protein